MHAVSTMRAKRSRLGFGFLVILAMLAVLLVFALVWRGSDDAREDSSRGVAREAPIRDASRSGEVSQSKQVARPAAVPQNDVSREAAAVRPIVELWFGIPMIEDALPASIAASQEAIRFEEWNTWLPADGVPSLGNAVNTADCGDYNPHRPCLNP